MTIRHVESWLPIGMTPADFGEATQVTGANGELFALISYLTSPLTEDSKADYVVFAIPQEFNPPPLGTLLINSIQIDKYHWTVTPVAAPDFKLKEAETEIGIFDFTPKGAGKPIKVEVQLLQGSTVLATLSLTQDVKARDPYLEVQIIQMENNNAPATQSDALRELINDFADYINAAASATGNLGIPARFLAAVLFMEIWARPKEGAANAKVYRKKDGGISDPTWFEWSWDGFKGKYLGMKRDYVFINFIRCVEIQIMADTFDDLTWVRKDFLGSKSLGVGQIANSTAAMLLDKITWREQQRGSDKDVETLKQINEEWQGMWRWDLVNIFNRLRFPKTNIQLSAMLLTRLKNRSHRWPNLLAADFCKDKKAVEIIATEFNVGAKNTDKTKAKKNGNGHRAYKEYVQNGAPLFPERYFP